MTYLFKQFEKLSVKEKKTIKLVLIFVLSLIFSLLIINSYKSHILDYKRLSVAKNQYHQAKKLLSQINKTQSVAQDLNKLINSVKKSKQIDDLFWENRDNTIRLLFKTKNLSVANKTLSQLQEKSSYTLSKITLNRMSGPYPYAIEANLESKH